MSLSHRVTELFESWFGGNTTPKVNIDSALPAGNNNIGNVDIETMPNVIISTLPSIPSGNNVIGQVKITDGTNIASVMQADGEMGLVTVTPGHICTDNSTTTPLGINGVFTGTAGEVVNHGVIIVSVKASHASATNGLSVQFSMDGTNWDITDTFTIPAGIGKTFSFQTAGRYYRIVYTNGVVAQTYFRMQSILKPYYVKPSSHRIADTISAQDDAELIKSVLTAENSTGFVNIQATPSNNLRVTDAENPLAIAKGEVSGASAINKWGNAPDFDATDGEVTIWDGAEDGATWELMRYVYSATADIDSVSSSNNTDNTDFTVIGLDANYNEVTQTITLNGQTRVALTTPLIRVFRAYNSNSTLFVGHIIVYVNTALTAGVPTDKTKIRAVIHPEEQQTEMAVYTIPAGKTGYLYSGYATTAGGNKTSNYIMRFKVRLFGHVFRTQQKVSISDTGTSFIQFNYPIPQALPEKTDVEVTSVMDVLGGTGASISAGFSIVLVDN